MNDSPEIQEVLDLRAQLAQMTQERDAERQDPSDVYQFVTTKPEMSRYITQLRQQLALRDAEIEKLKLALEYNIE